MHIKIENKCFYLDVNQDINAANVSQVCENIALKITPEITLFYDFKFTLQNNQHLYLDLGEKINFPSNAYFRFSIFEKQKF